MSAVNDLKRRIAHLEQENAELTKQLKAKVVKEFHVAYVHWTGGKEHGFVIPADEGGRIRVKLARAEED